MIPTTRTIQIDTSIPFTLPASDPSVACAVYQGFRFRDPGGKVPISEGDSLLPNSEGQGSYTFTLWDEAGSYFGISIQDLRNEKGWIVSHSIQRSFVPFVRK